MVVSVRSTIRSSVPGSRSTRGVSPLEDIVESLPHLHFSIKWNHEGAVRMCRSLETILCLVAVWQSTSTRARLTQIRDIVDGRFSGLFVVRGWSPGAGEVAKRLSAQTFGRASIERERRGCCDLQLPHRPQARLGPFIHQRGIGSAASPFLPPHCEIRQKYGGGRGIRTPGTLAGTVVFKTTCLNRSHIPPRAYFIRKFASP